MTSEYVRLKKGDRVRIRLAGTKDEWCEGYVVLASDTDPASVGLLLSGMVRAEDAGLIGGILPLMVDYKALTVISLFRHAYELEVAE